MVLALVPVVGPFLVLILALFDSTFIPLEMSGNCAIAALFVAALFNQERARKAQGHEYEGNHSVGNTATTRSSEGRSPNLMVVNALHIHIQSMLQMVKCPYVIKLHVLRSQR